MHRLRTNCLRLLAVAATIAIVTVAAAPAFAGTITTPGAGFTAPLNASGTGPAPFLISATGYTPATSVKVEICDGVSSADPAWDPSSDCDLGTSPNALFANSGGNVTWDPSKPGQSIGVFDGASPQNFFNCLYPGEPSPNNGNVDYTNCQLKVSTQLATGTSDQAFVTFTLPKPSPPVAETRYVILLPLGALVLLGGGYLALRRRNGPSSTAATA